MVCDAAVGAVVFLFLSLPQAQSAKTSASAKNIAIIFFISFSCEFFDSEKIGMHAYFVHSAICFCICRRCNLWQKIWLKSAKKSHGKHVVGGIGREGGGLSVGGIRRLIKFKKLTLNIYHKSRKKSTPKSYNVLIL